MQLKLYVISLIRYFGLTSLVGLDPLDQAPLLKGDNTIPEETNLAPPIFEPPGTGKDNRIQCNYTGLPGWWHPDSPDLRGVWLRNNKTGREYNITTDYETSWPQGVRRDVSI